MLQDISFGRLENEYRPCPISPDDYVLCIRDREILLGQDDRGFFLPTYQQILSCAAQWDAWGDTPWRYAFRMLGRNYFLWMGTAGSCPEDRFTYRNARSFRELNSKDTCFAALTGWHLYQWYRTSRFCGQCGTPTVHDSKERMVRCPACGHTIFPRINPAVIVAVTNGDKLLLTKYAGRSYTRYALIAGFTEIGETLEQTVQREVMEEVGLKIKNIRYYKSQPWGIDGNILMGFFCDLDGEDTIHLDVQELAVGEWHHRSCLPAHDDGFSLTREMVGIFERGLEPSGGL